MLNCATTHPRKFFRFEAFMPIFIYFLLAPSGALYVIMCNYWSATLSDIL